MAMKVLVTGATGFIGSHLVWELLAQGAEVRALCRPRRDWKTLAHLPVEVVEGDITDLRSLREALRGVKQVYHAAALYALWAPARRWFYEVNIAGTRNVLEAAWEAGVERVVYTSTHATVGVAEDPTLPVDESRPFNRWKFSNEYVRSKALAEQEVAKFVAAGLPVVIVNPTAPIGPGDHKPTPTGEFLVRLLNGQLRFYIDAQVNFVHVRDVARGHLLAMERGRPGERYLLGGTNTSVRKVIHLVREIAGDVPRCFQVPGAVAVAAGYLGEAWSKLTGRRPPVDAGSIKFLLRCPPVDSRRAVAELGLPQTPLEEALREAIAWYRDQGYLRKAGEDRPKRSR
jgi:dihydroflavonol-4-reductase